MNIHFNDMPIGKKFILTGTAVILVGMTLFSLVIFTFLGNRMKQQMTSELQDKVEMTMNMVEAYNDRLKKEADVLAGVFESSLPGRYSLDTSQTLLMNGIETPLLRAGNTALNRNHEPADRFTRMTGAVATVFVKSGSEFVRVATSLKKEDGSRAVGTALDRTHPAYDHLMKGEGYTGKAVLFGKDYMTQYRPVEDASGRVIGSIFIGVDFTESLALLKSRIKNISIGETGYIYVLNAAGKDAGVLAFHPTMQGKSILEWKDVRGNEFVKDILQKKDGVATYFWNNQWKGGDSVRQSGAQEKQIAYRHFRDWDWIIVGGSTTDELLKNVYTIRNSLIGASLVLAGVLSVALWFMVSRLIVIPLGKSIAMIRELKKGHLRQRLHLDRKDEIGLLGDTMDEFADDLQDNVVGTLKKVAAGDVSCEVKIKDDQDEINPAFRQMIDTLRALVAEAGMLSKAAVEGKLDTRGNAGKFQGGYRDIVKGVNDTLDAVIGPLNMSAEYVDRIAKGDIPPKITDKYNGDFNEIKNNLNLCIDTLNGLVGEIGMLSRAAVEGQLATRGNAGKFQGGYHEMVKGINDTLDALINPLTRTIEHLENLSNGKIDDLITREYKGDYIRLKTGFNKCFTAINTLVADANMLSEAAVQGRLETRAETAKHQGDFLRIIEGVNHTLDAMVEPINDASAVLGRMASNDFTEYMSKDYRGDYALIKDNINKVLETLNESLRKVSESTQQVAATTQELSATAEEMASGAEEQTTQTQQVATSMEEMTATIRQVAKSAGEAAKKSKEAGATAANGGEVVQNTVNEIDNISKVVRELQEVITSLSRNSAKIGDIVGVIDDVADQTNLLALNAAIEAARAGEQGRGFAVVADEVRKLAERTTSSTKEIAGMVKSIQEDTSKAVISMETSANQVEGGVVYAVSAGNALSEIVQNAKVLEEMVQQIATAAEQQSAAAEEISSNIESISSVSKQNATGATQTSSAVQNLAELTDGLQSMVGKFRLNDAAGAAQVHVEHKHKEIKKKAA